MDPWKDPPGWRTEVRWGVATSLAALLVLPLVPIAIAVSVVSGIVRRVSRWYNRDMR